MDKDVSLSKESCAFSIARRNVLFGCFVSSPLFTFLFFSAAFPFFNNVDEPAHFHLVLDYAHCHVPRGLENTSPGNLRFTWHFSALAPFLAPPPAPCRRRPWTEPVDKMKQDLAFNATVGWQTQKNYEDSEPPLYYALAVLWCGLRPISRPRQWPAALLVAVL